MKLLLAALAWLLLFGGLGAIAMGGAAIMLIPHHVPAPALLRVAAAGIAPGLLAWLIALCFALLPGARPPRNAPQFGLRQGLWSIAGAGLMLLCGSLLPFALAIYIALLRILHGQQAHMPDQHSLPLLAACLLASELLAGLWITWYFNRQSRMVVTEGAPSGIAWRPAAPGAYGIAALCALATLALGAAEFHFHPPDMSKLADLPMAQLFQGPPVIMALVLFVTIGMAPVLEEVLFRGLAFAGIAARLGPAWAVILTTAIFTALHAPEKIYYKLGFADVAAIALLACALRLRYRSIKPGILLHFLYNFGMILVPALS